MPIAGFKAHVCAAWRLSTTCKIFAVGGSNEYLSATTTLQKRGHRAPHCAPARPIVISSHGAARMNIDIVGDGYGHHPPSTQVLLAWRNLP